MFAIASVGDFFIYLYLDALIYVVISMAVIGMVRRSTGASDMVPMILSRVPHIGLFGLFLGLIPALGNIADPQSIGPALAFGYLSFLYASIASVGYKLANPSITNGIKPIGWPFVGWTLVVLLTSAMLILASLQLSTT